MDSIKRILGLGPKQPRRLVDSEDGPRQVIVDDSDVEFVDPNIPDSLNLPSRRQERYLAAEREIGPPAAIFSWMNPRNPRQARRRLGTLYWKGFKRVAMAFFLFMFGLTFLLIGAGCSALCDERERGWAYMLIGGLLFMPGAFSLSVLVQYLRGVPRVSYRELPEFEM
jgi:hypothetical protein